MEICRFCMTTLSVSDSIEIPEGFYDEFEVYTGHKVSKTHRTNRSSLTNSFLVGN